MSPQAPPRWLEHLLLLSLPARDREAISGDLLEEYREEKRPHLGALRANLWYARQAISFFSHRTLGGPPMKTALVWTSVATAAAGLWLACMENILKHPGYAERTAIAAGIVTQGLATLLVLLLDARWIPRILVSLGAAAAAILGASVIKRILDAPHFEGFILLVGVGLIVQGVLTVTVVLRPRHSHAL